APVPYFHLSAPDDRIRGSIGLLAQAGDWDARRSVPPDLLAELAVDRCAYSFQLGSPIPNAIDASTSDILELASRLQTMELVVTADTMLAHLAGALAVPTWTLLAYEADWRWMVDRSDSPWYPTMRLFRQSTPGDWPGVIQAVRTALRQ
ncbi:MAG: ADP-heptose--LPS heptosyltransferase, partial [Chloroflexi bacterium]|nr:ADP-heptose--LPS heptosyltransferase [Chloroflexota bacterium]